MHYTSGTTGKPKGAVHRHQAVVQQYATGQVGTGSARGRHLLVHRRPGLGYRHVLRDARAVDERRYSAHLRGRLPRQRLVRADREAQGYGLVHRAYGDPYADEGRATRYRSAMIISSLRFTASVGEPLNPEAVVWGHEDAIGHAIPRQLVADGDGRDHVRELRLDADKAGLHGQADSGCGSWASWMRTSTPCRRARTATLVVQARLAVNVPPVLAEPRNVQFAVQEGLVYHGRHGAGGRGRLLLVRRSRGRRDQHGGAPGRPVRGGERV